MGVVISENKSFERTHILESTSVLLRQCKFSNGQYDLIPVHICFFNFDISEHQGLTYAPYIQPK